MRRRLRELESELEEELSKRPNKVVVYEAGGKKLKFSVTTKLCGDQVTHDADKLDGSDADSHHTE